MANGGPAKVGLRLGLPLVLFLLLKAILFAGLALNSRYVMDEYTQAGYSLKIPEGFYRGIDPIKTVLYVYVFNLARLLSDNAVDLMCIARLEGAFLAIVTAVLTFGISRRLGRSVLESLFAVATLVSFSNFMERAFRVRSDTVAVFFVALAFFVAAGRAGARRALPAGLFAGAAFLSTQKAIYALAAIAVGFLASETTLSGIRRSAAKLAAFCVGVGTAILSYAIWFGGQEFPRVIRMMIESPLHFAPLGNNPYYTGLDTFIWQTLRRNIVPYTLGILGLLAVGASWRNRDSGERFAAVTSIMVALLVFHHNQPWPYTFVIVFPFLSIWSIEALRFVANRASVSTGSLMAVALPLLATSLPRNLQYFRIDNRAQNEVTAVAESMLGPGDRYFDGIGMVPTRHMSAFVSWEAMVLARVRQNAAHGDVREIEEILEGRPKLWIVNYRVDGAREALRPFLDRSYVRVFRNILLSGVALPGSEEVLFLNRWPGPYRLWERDGRPAAVAFTLNGKEASGVVHLEAGSNRLARMRTADTRPLWLFPADAEPLGPLPPAEPPYDLFAAVYD